MKPTLVFCCFCAALSLAACSEAGAPAETEAPAAVTDGAAASDASATSTVDASSSDVASSASAGDILDQCRSRAASEYGVALDDVATLEPESDRVDGTFPVNGSLSDGRRFQCNFTADSELTDFVKVAQAPAIETDPRLANFEGARAGQAEMGLQRMGYEIARSEGLTSYWLNASGGQCYAITTSDGRYSKVEARPRSDCG